MSIPLLALTGLPSREENFHSNRRSPDSRLAARSGSIAAANATAAETG